MASYPCISLAFAAAGVVLLQQVLYFLIDASIIRALVEC